MLTLTRRFLKYPCPFWVSMIIVIHHTLAYGASLPEFADEQLRKKFPETRIASDLPANIQEKLSQIINHRRGILPESDMLTTEVRSYVDPDRHYRFSPGSLELVDNPKKVTAVSSHIVTPDFAEVRGKWTRDPGRARGEANVLGKNGVFYFPDRELTIPCEDTTAEKLAYYNATLLNEGDVLKIESPFPVPVSVVKFGKNYEKGYLTLPTHGGGYYLEVHDTPHLWSHLDRDGRGYVFLGKQTGPDTYHVSAFRIPYGQAIYAPGGVIHCDGLLIGNIYAIYTVTPNYSTGLIISPDGITPTLKITHSHAKKIQEM